jgi:hypothetical protein
MEYGIALLAIVNLSIAYSIIKAINNRYKVACSERDAYKSKLEELAKKTQMEQELDLATMDQLREEIFKRVGPHILVMPAAPCCEKRCEIGLKIEFYGINSQAAAGQILTAAGQVMMHHPQDEQE